MDRMERICRILAGVLLWCGLVGFAGYILWSMQPSQAPFYGLIDALYAPFMEHLPSNYQTRQEMTVAGGFFKASATWVGWYYSPLNLHYLAMAMLFFAPALGCHLLARGLAGHRRHDTVRPDPP